MKWVKRIFRVVLSLIGVLILFVLIVLGVDAQRTNYLKTYMDSTTSNTFLIVNANVLPMTKDTILPNKMVYVQDGVIREIDDHIETPKNIEVLDAANAYLMPGLIDMHVHLWDRYELGVYLANGVTAIRNLWGMPMHLRIKKAIHSEKIIAPMFFTTGPKLTGPEFIGDDNLQLTSSQEATEKIMLYKERGYDFIKTYYNLPPDIFDAIVKQATVSEIDIVAHPSQKVSYSYHLHPQIKSIEHAEDIVQQALNYQLDTAVLQQVIQDFKQAPHASFCPTLIVYYNIYEMLKNDVVLNTLQQMNPLIRKVDSHAQYERWHTTKVDDPSITIKIKQQHDFHLFIIKQLYDAGVNVVCGTDAGIGITEPGVSIHQELAFYKQAGLSNYEVLKTATSNAARVHQRMNNMGTIEVGKTANLLLLNDNPLSDLSALQKPTTVVIQGRKIHKETLRSFKEKAKNRKNLLATGVRYVENLFVEKVIH